MAKVVPGYKKQAKEKIMDSASALFFEFGYHETGMDRVASKIGVTKGTLYLYFKSKEELLNETCKRNMDLLEESLGNAISNDLVKGAEIFFEKELEMPDYIKFHWIFALGEMKSNEYVRKVITESYEKYIEIVSQKIEELRKKAIIPEESDSLLLSRMLIAFHNGILISVMQGLDKDAAINMFRAGLRDILFYHNKT